MKQYIWASMGDDKVRASHAALNGQVRDWTDSPAPGEESNCRCSAVPASFLGADAYEPEDDSVYLAGVELFGKSAKTDLDEHSSLIEDIAKFYEIDPNLIRGVIINETSTRLGAGVVDAIASRVREAFGGFGTYGPAQLGPDARGALGLSITDVMSYEGAIIGAAGFLNIEKERLIAEGIENPSNAQIASRYNWGSWDFTKAPTKYGIRVQYLIDRFYSPE